MQILYTKQIEEDLKQQKDIAKCNLKGILFFSRTWEDNRTSYRDTDIKQKHFIITESLTYPTKMFVHSIRSTSDVSVRINETEISQFGYFC